MRRSTSVRTGNDSGAREVFDNVNELAHGVWKRDRVFLLLPPIRARKNGRAPPTAHFLDNGLTVSKDLLGRQLLASPDDCATLKQAPIARERLSIRVHEDIRDAYAILIIVVATVKSRYGCVGALYLHHLSL